VNDYWSGKAMTRIVGTAALIFITSGIAGTIVLLANAQGIDLELGTIGFVIGATSGTCSGLVARALVSARWKTRVGIGTGLLVGGSLAWAFWAFLNYLASGIPNFQMR
jgi:hypothetical protein